MHYMQISFLLLIEALVLNVINSTVPVLRDTLECPTDETSWMQSSEAFDCPNHQEYHCLPTLFLNGSVEGCLNVTEIQPGFCAIYNPYAKNTLIDAISKCDQINEFDCPKDFYDSNKTFHYLSCQKINPIEGCYLAKPNCPNITSTDTKALSDPTDSPETGGASDARKLFPLNGICQTMCLSIIMIKIICRWILPFG